MRTKHYLLAIVISSSTFGLAQNTFPTSGSVGIGTSTPSAKLDVNGNMIVDSSLVVKDSIRVMEKLTVDKDAVFNQDISVIGVSSLKGDVVVDGTLDLNMFVNTQSTDDAFLMVKSNGEVKKLDFAGLNEITYSTSCFPLQGAGQQQYYLAPSWQAAGGPNPTDSKLFTGINCPAYVGIGTEFPYQILDVRGRTYISQGLGVGLNTHNSNYTIHIREQTAGQDIMLIENPTEEIFKIKSDGLIYAREMKLTLNPFPDYVFEKDYDLMSIGELDAYIKTNGHLPHMPSADVVDKDGIGIGDLVVKQQQTIEELSLYIIQLEKRLQALENKE